MVNSLTFFASIFKLVETPGGGRSSIFTYVHMHMAQTIFKDSEKRLFLEKKDYFWGYEEIVDIFGWSKHMTNWTNLGDHFYIIWDCLIFLIFFIG